MLQFNIFNNTHTMPGILTGNHRKLNDPFDSTVDCIFFYLHIHTYNHAL